VEEGEYKGEKIIKLKDAQADHQPHLKRRSNSGAHVGTSPDDLTRLTRRSTGLDTYNRQHSLISVEPVGIVPRELGPVLSVRLPTAIPRS